MRNFREQQAEAQHNTARLVVLYLCSVVGTVATPTLPVWLAAGPAWGGGTAGILLVCILGATAFKFWELRGGGRVVAEQLDGRRIAGDPDTAEERRVRNVVEEMAIASGLPVPPVYVLDEAGINAFSAGYTPDDAVIGVTQGCIEHLTRDELQGVIAHEFSHILNGDIRLNHQLVGWTYGLGAVTAFWIVNPLLRLLAWIWVVGYLGSQFIKAQVCREREFLADAAAVQFTRNPEGIGGALVTIRDHEAGATLEREGVETVSHLFFENAVDDQFFPTHPSLTKRILRIDPQLEKRALDAATREGEGNEAREETGSAEAGAIVGGDPAEAMEPAALLQGEALREALPDELLSTVHEPLGAVAIAYALMLDADDSMRERQLALLRERETRAVVDETERTFPLVAGLERRLRLPLVELGAPALRDLSDDQRVRLHDTVRALAEADDRLTVFEYALETVVRHQLEHHDRPDGDTVQYRRFSAVSEDVVVLLSALVRVGHDDEADAREVFHMAYQSLAEAYDAPEEVLVEAPPEDLDRALDRLAVAAPALQEAVLEACATCVHADDEVGAQEKILLRAVAAALDIPRPVQLEDR